MKIKVAELLIIITIVFMLGGILSSVKSNSNEETTEIISDFFNSEEYDGMGNESIYFDDEDNINIIGKANEQIGNGLTKAVDGIINFFFDLIKKLVS